VREEIIRFVSLFQERRNRNERSALLPRRRPSCLFHSMIVLSFLIFSVEPGRGIV